MNESYKCVRLYAWLRRYGNGAVPWKAFVVLDFTQRASEALMDMHNIYCNASNKEIVAFFRGNQGRGQTAPAVGDDHDTSSALPWVLQVRQIHRAEITKPWLFFERLFAFADCAERYCCAD